MMINLIKLVYGFGKQIGGEGIPGLVLSNASYIEWAG